MNPTLILASTSPRRIDLLTQSGLTLTVVPPNADEAILPREKPKNMVARLAREKAEVVAGAILSGAVKNVRPADLVILAADTTVVAPDGKKILAKPENEKDACKMLSLLVGKTHTVLTGYCIFRLIPSRKKKGQFDTHILVRVVQSKVKMRSLNKKMIESYVKTGEPMDKAGAYAAQGIGMGFIEAIQGSYSNVVGLPLSEVLVDLEMKFGFKFLQSPLKKKKSSKK